MSHGRTGQQQPTDELAGGRRVHVTVPPRSCPAPWTVKGRWSPATSAPRSRSACSIGVNGRAEAWASAVNRTSACDKAATGGRNRITVPASPQSMSARSGAGPGSTTSRWSSMRMFAPALGGLRSSRWCPGLRASQSGAAPASEGRQHERAVGHGFRTGDADGRVEVVIALRRRPRLHGLQFRWGAAARCATMVSWSPSNG